MPQPDTYKETNMNEDVVNMNAAVCTIQIIQVSGAVMQNCPDCEPEYLVMP